MKRVGRSTHLSLRQILIASLISQAIVAVGLTGYFSWKNGRKTVEDLALRLSREVTSHTQEHIEDYLDTPIEFLKINRVFARQGKLELTNHQDLQNIFWQQTHINPQIHTLYFGSHMGNFLQVEMKDSPKVSIRDRDTAPYWHIYRLDDKGQKVEFLERKKYDPRERPWYRAAIEHNDLIWSPIYLFADPPVLGITPAIPLKNKQSGQIAGVMAIDLTLEDISQFLGSLKIGDRGRAFIIEPSGKMVATSTTKSLVRRSTLGNERLHYSHSSDPLIKSTAEFLATELNNFKSESNQQLIFEFETNRYFVQATSLDGYPGLNWLMVTVIPESDFIEHIRNNTYTTLLLSTLALISAIFLGALLNQLVINSVSHLSHVAKAISDGQIIAIEQQPKIRELAIVRDSINSMVSQLQTSTTNIKSLESRWKRKVEESTRNLRRENRELNRLAHIDSLTQIYNRYHFDRALKQLWQETIEERGSIALIMCDIDSFKAYNDTYGHLMGDSTLRQVAQIISNKVNRNKDVAARYGGEEFAIILPRTNGEGAVQVANTIINSVWELDIPHNTSNVANRVTLSCGVACIIPSPSSSTQDLLESADDALYQAKQRGKNRCVLGTNL